MTQPHSMFPDPNQDPRLKKIRYRYAKVASEAIVALQTSGEAFSKENDPELERARALVTYIMYCNEVKEDEGG